MILPVESIVVVPVPPNCAKFAEISDEEALPVILIFPLNNEFPNTSKIFPVVDVAFVPRIRISDVSVGYIAILFVLDR